MKDSGFEIYLFDSALHFEIIYLFSWFHVSPLPHVLYIIDTNSLSDV